MLVRPTLLVILFLLVLGCASRDTPPVDYAVRNVPASERGEMMERAEAALVGLGYSIAQREIAGGVLTTVPVAVERGEGRSVRAENPLRKVAEVRIAGSGDAMRVHCKVVIQEQGYENYNLLAYERGGDDLPGHQTAIDRDAATTAEQNSVWRTIRRDRTAEREILDRITAGDEVP